MKQIKLFIIQCFCLIAPVIFPSLLSQASDSAGKQTFPADSVIVWLNLLVIFLLFLKFAVKPLIDFLKGRKKKLSEEFADLEMKKETILGEIKDINKSVNEKQSGLESEKKQIIKQAEKKLNEIMKEAEHESSLILDRAKQKTENRILREKEKLYAEIRSEILSKSMDETSAKVSVKKTDDINGHDD